MQTPKEQFSSKNVSNSPDLTLNSHNDITRCIKQTLKILYFGIFVYLSDERETGVLSSLVSMASSVPLLLAERRLFILSTTSEATIKQRKIIIPND